MNQMSVVERRGQVSLEYVILIGILLVILIPIFYYSLTTSSEKVKLSQAENTVLTLSKAVEEVYSLSPGTKKYVWLSIPGGVQEARITGSEITLVVGVAGKSSDYTAFTKAIVVGNIPTEKGVYRIPVELLESGVVQIGSSEDTKPPSITWISPAGAGCNPVTLRATTDESAACKYDTQDTSYFAMSYTMSGNALGHNAELGAQPEGNYHYFVRCSDAFGNTMNSSSVIGYSINFTWCSQQASSNQSNQSNQSSPPWADLQDIGIHNGWYFKTNGQGLYTQDSAMASWTNITLDLLDDNVNTPSTTSVIRTRSGEKYEGFVAFAQGDTNQYTRVVLYGRVRIVDASPFILRVYPYYSNSSINPTLYAEFTVSSSILNENVKWVELDITNIAKTEDGAGWLRTRITASNASSQENKRFQFSELHYKVG